ncbi:integration host factor subunit alpha [Magnetofaba australis]|uniref:Integration host factor subunit alpha n=1 Tax=Magnetofaba australis IT-1 TaxID=1434232 RepID=A0A1Y2K7W7_9PROT|nr:integration host factor subunit alpha [Magnetofaba australis]OSM06153.1 putative integration host factor subunit alpha [Magnetofaba australis IT-1]
MTKADIVQSVYQRIGVSKKESADIVEGVFEAIRTSLEDGDPVKISGFGNFNMRAKRPRQGRNPKTGDEVEISARKVVTFKASQILLNKVNTGNGKG